MLGWFQRETKGNTHHVEGSQTNPIQDILDLGPFNIVYFGVYVHSETMWGPKPASSPSHLLCWAQNRGGVAKRPCLHARSRRCPPCAEAMQVYLTDPKRDEPGTPLGLVVPWFSGHEGVVVPSVLFCFPLSKGKARNNKKQEGQPPRLFHYGFSCWNYKLCFPFEHARMWRRNPLDCA